MKTFSIIRKINEILHTKMNQFQQLIFPPKPLEYLDNFFQIQESIYLKETRQIISKIYLLISLLTVKILHFLYLAFNPNLTEIDRTLHFDALHLLIPKEKYNALVAITVIMAIYYLNKLFLHGNYQLNKILRNVLIERDGNIFIRPRLGKNLACDLVRRVCCGSMYLFQTFSLAVGKLGPRGLGGLSVYDVNEFF